MLIDFEFMKTAFFEVIRYLPVTLTIAATAIVAGILLGLLIALIQVKRIPILHQLSVVFVSFMRGTPVIVQLYLVYFGLPLLSEGINKMLDIGTAPINPSAIICASLAFSFNSGAFLSVVFRSAILSVDNTQLEGAISIGMTNLQTYQHVILPQAFRAALPLLGNNFLGIIKGTSLAFSISVMEITAKAIAVGSVGLKFTESYIVVAFIYFAVCKAVELAFHMAERKLNVY